MARMFRAGQTMFEIGQAYGLTRQRVHQILKEMGLSRRDGGAFVRRTKKLEKLLKGR